MKLKRKKDVEIHKNVGAPLSTNPADAKRELSNIRPREVSLVDSAANGRKFLIVKNKDGKAQDAKLFKNENEDESKPAQPATQPEGDPKPADQKEAEGEQVPAPGEAGEGGAEAAGDEYDGGEVEIEKGEFTTTATSILSNVPVSKALAMQQKDMFMAMSDALMSMAFSMDMIRMDIMSFSESDGKTGFMGEQIIKSLTKEFGEEIEPEKMKVLVEKKGRKMKKARLDKLKGVVESLGSLIKELEDDETIEKGGVVVSKKAEQAKPEAEVKKESGKEETKPTEEKTEKAAEGGESKPLTAADLDAAVEKAVEKHVKPLQEEIKKMKDSPADASGEEANSTEEVEKNADGKGKEKEVKKGKAFWGGVIR